MRFTLELEPDTLPLADLPELLRDSATWVTCHLANEGRFEEIGGKVVRDKDGVLIGRWTLVS